MRDNEIAVVFCDQNPAYKRVAFEIPDNWNLRNDLIEIIDGVVLARRLLGDMFEYNTSTLITDFIEIGKKYSSADYEIITETEGDHMLFKVVRRKDV